MLFRNKVNLSTLAETPSASDNRTKVTFANHTFIKKDTRVGSTMNFDFLVNNEDVIAEKGTRPGFNLIKSINSAGSHTLERRGSDVYLDNALLRANTKVLIVEIVGAGGGGCGGHSLDNGSGGGAGGYCCVLLDFIKYTSYTITLGAGGNGIHGDWSGPTAEAGGSSTISANGVEICRGDGGNGGRGHAGADGGNGFLGNGVLGYVHWGHAGAIEEQDSHLESVSITGITPFNEPAKSYPARQGNGRGNNTGGAGGCSVLANGGDGGTKVNGQNGTLGSGGGGGGARASTTGGRGGDGALNIYY